RPGSKNANADMLSRLPLKVMSQEPCFPSEILLLQSELEDSPITNQHIVAWTNNDDVLTRVRRSIHTGHWENSSDPKILPYYKRRNELSVEKDCVLLGPRVVIPEEGRKPLLIMLH